MQVFRGLRHPSIASACALTIGSFDGVHRGRQAMLAMLTYKARHRGGLSCGHRTYDHPQQRTDVG
jgi:riboflavin kinase / FMN adenylyltransferase